MGSVPPSRILAVDLLTFIATVVSTRGRGATKIKIALHQTGAVPANAVLPDSRMACESRLRRRRVNGPCLEPSRTLGVKDTSQDGMKVVFQFVISARRN